MKENSNKVLSFPSRVPAKADYQRVKANYSLREIKQLFGLRESTIRRWTEQGIIQGRPTAEANEYSYDFQALVQFRRVRELRAQGVTQEAAYEQAEARVHADIVAGLNQLTELRKAAVTQTGRPEAAIDNIARFVCDFYTHHDYHTFLAQAA